MIIRSTRPLRASNNAVSAVRPSFNAPASSSALPSTPSLSHEAWFGYLGPSWAKWSVRVSSWEHLHRSCADLITRASYLLANVPLTRPLDTPPPSSRGANPPKTFEDWARRYVRPGVHLSTFVQRGVDPDALQERELAASKSTRTPQSRRVTFCPFRALTAVEDGPPLSTVLEFLLLCDSPVDDNVVARLLRLTADIPAARAVLRAAPPAAVGPNSIEALARRLAECGDPHAVVGLASLAASGVLAAVGVTPAFYTLLIECVCDATGRDVVPYESHCEASAVRAHAEAAGVVAPSSEVAVGPMSVAAFVRSTKASLPRSVVEFDERRRMEASQQHENSTPLLDALVAVTEGRAPDRESALGDSGLGGGGGSGDGTSRPPRVSARGVELCCALLSLMRSYAASDGPQWLPPARAYVAAAAAGVRAGRLAVAAGVLVDMHAAGLQFTVEDDIVAHHHATRTEAAVVARGLDALFSLAVLMRGSDVVVSALVEIIPASLVGDWIGRGVHLEQAKLHTDEGADGEEDDVVSAVVKVMVRGVAEASRGERFFARPSIATALRRSRSASSATTPAQSVDAGGVDGAAVGVCMQLAASSGDVIMFVRAVALWRAFGAVPSAAVMSALQEGVLALSAHTARLFPPLRDSFVEGTSVAGFANCSKKVPPLLRPFATLLPPSVLPSAPRVPPKVASVSKSSIWAGVMDAPPSELKGFDRVSLFGFGALSLSRSAAFYNADGGLRAGGWLASAQGDVVAAAAAAMEAAGVSTSYTSARTVRDEALALCGAVAVSVSGTCAIASGCEGAVLASSAYTVPLTRLPLLNADALQRQALIRQGNGDPNETAAHDHEETSSLVIDAEAERNEVRGFAERLQSVPRRLVECAFPPHVTTVVVVDASALASPSPVEREFIANATRTASCRVVVPTSAVTALLGAARGASSRVDTLSALSPGLLRLALQQVSPLLTASLQPLTGALPSLRDVHLAVASGDAQTLSIPPPSAFPPSTVGVPPLHSPRSAVTEGSATAQVEPLSDQETTPEHADPPATEFSSAHPSPVPSAIPPTPFGVEASLESLFGQKGGPSSHPTPSYPPTETSPTHTSRSSVAHVSPQPRGRSLTHPPSSSSLPTRTDLPLANTFLLGLQGSVQAMRHAVAKGIANPTREGKETGFALDAVLSGKGGPLAEAADCVLAMLPTHRRAVPHVVPHQLYVEGDNVFSAEELRHFIFHAAQWRRYLAKKKEAEDLGEEPPPPPTSLPQDPGTQLLRQQLVKRRKRFKRMHAAHAAEENAERQREGLAAVVPPHVRRGSERGVAELLRSIGTILSPAQPLDHTLAAAVWLRDSFADAGRAVKVVVVTASPVVRRKAAHLRITTVGS